MILGEFKCNSGSYNREMIAVVGSYCPLSKFGSIQVQLDLTGCTCVFVAFI